MWGRGAYDLRRSKARRVGNEGALDEWGEHFNCSGVIPGGLEAQGLGKGPSSMLTGGAAEHGVFCGPDFLPHRTMDGALAPGNANSDGPGGRSEMRKLDTTGGLVVP